MIMSREPQATKIRFWVSLRQRPEPLSISIFYDGDNKFFKKQMSYNPVAQKKTPSKL